MSVFSSSVWDYFGLGWVRYLIGATFLVNFLMFIFGAVTSLFEWFLRQVDSVISSAAGCMGTAWAGVGSVTSYMGVVNHFVPLDLFLVLAVQVTVARVVVSVWRAVKVHIPTIGG